MLGKLRPVGIVTAFCAKKAPAGEMARINDLELNKATINNELVKSPKSDTFTAAKKVTQKDVSKLSAENNRTDDVLESVVKNN